MDTSIYVIEGIDINDDLTSSEQKDKLVKAFVNTFVIVGWGALGSLPPEDVGMMSSYLVDQVYFWVDEIKKK